MAIHSSILAWKVSWTEEPGNTLSFFIYSYLNLGLPSWLSGKESAHQFRGHRFDPRSWRIPRAVGQLSPCATITEPLL